MSDVLYDKPYTARSNLVNFIPSKSAYKRVYFNRRRDQCWLFKKKANDKEDPKDGLKNVVEKEGAPAGSKDINDSKP